MSRSTRSTRIILRKGTTMRTRPSSRAVALLFVAFLTLTVAPPLANAITLSPGDILVTDLVGTSRIDPHTGLVTPFSFVGGNGISYGAGQIYVTTPANTLVRIDRDTGDGTVVSSGGLFTLLRSVAVAPNGDVYVLNGQPFTSLASVILVNPKSGAQTVVASGITNGGSDLAVAPDGSIWVATTLGIVWRVDPDTGKITFINEGSHEHRIDINADGVAIVGGRSHFFLYSAQGDQQAGFGVLEPDEDVNEVEEVNDVALGPDLQLYVAASSGKLYRTTPAHLASDEDSVLLGPQDVLAEISGFAFITVVTPLPASIILLVVGVASGAAWAGGHAADDRSVSSPPNPDSRSPLLRRVTFPALTFGIGTLNASTTQFSGSRLESGWRIHRMILVAA